MNILNFFKNDKPAPVEIKQDTSMQMFSTPLGNIGVGDLTKPYVRAYSTAEPYVRYGDDNLFPQILNQLAVQSGLNGSILRFKSNAVIGSGYEIEMYDNTTDAKINWYKFEQRNKLNKLCRELTDDLVIHGRMHVLRCATGNGYSYKRLAPEKIRVNETRSILTYSSDWSRYIGQKTYPEYYDGCTAMDSVISYYICSPGGDIYPYVPYQGCLNWVFLSSEIPFLQKDNIQNSIYPSYVIKSAGKFNSEQEKELFRRTIEQLKTPSKRGKVAAFVAQNIESLPIIEALPTNDIPKAFTELMKDISENIAVAHMINPAIMGVKVAGQLGATTEIEDSYRIFEKNYVIPTRLELEEFLNTIIDIAGINGKIVIKDLQIENDKIIDKTKVIE